MAWYENATIQYDWVRYGEDLDDRYARHVVQKALDLHTDTLAFCVQVGGYALWDSKVTPKAEMIGKMDLIGEMARLCREKGLHFVPWWLGTALGVEAILRKHPSWQIVGPPRDDGSQKKHNYICYNTPYRDLLYEEIREVLDAYQPDGIYFDQLPGSCYCQWCRAKFDRRYGRAMPIVADEFFVYNSAAGLPTLLRQFRDDSVREFCAGVRKIINEVSPDTCYAQNWVRNQQSYLAIGAADVLLPEFYQKDDLLPLGLKHRLTRTYFDHGAIWGNVRHSVKHDARHHPVRGTQMLLVECVANHASPLMLDLCCIDFDPTGTDELAETFDHIRSMQGELAGAEPVRYAALLHSRRSHELYPGRFDEAFEGMYRLLLEAHVPFEIVNEAGLQRGELGDYKVLVMPDAVSLAEPTIEAIRTAAADGMGLVGSYMTGLVDDKGGQRPQPALADLFGFKMTGHIAYDARKGRSGDPVLNLPGIESERLFHYGSVEVAHELAEGIPAAARFAFEGGFVVIQPAPDCQTLGHVHAIDQLRMHGRPHNRPGVYPGPARWPLAVTRQAGSARVAYFAVQAEAAWRRVDAPELDSLMLKSVLWAGGPVPLETADCPRSVEVRLFHDPRKKTYQILLVNLTTNPLLKAPGGWGVVRYVTPHKQLALSLKVAGKVTEAGSLLGAEVKCDSSGQGVSLELSRLDLYDLLTVKYA